MLETVQILKAIEDNNAKDLLLKVKDTSTGKVLGVDYNYVADEILFIFASETGNGSCSNYLKQLEYESHDKCWESYACDNEGLRHPDDVEDWEEDVPCLFGEAMDKAKYEVVTGLNTRVYVGNQGDCPIRHFDKSYEMTGIEVTEDALVLLYTSTLSKAVYTTDVVDFINENKTHHLPLRFKNSKTGEVVGFDSHYVVDGIYFVIANKDNDNSCDLYLHNLDSEACDECWNCHIDEKALDIDVDDMTYHELQEYRLQAVKELETSLYVGNFKDFDSCTDFKEMKSIELLDDCVCISY